MTSALAHYTFKNSTRVGLRLAHINKTRVKVSDSNKPTTTRVSSRLAHSYKTKIEVTEREKPTSTFYLIRVH